MIKNPYEFDAAAGGGVWGDPPAPADDVPPASGPAKTSLLAILSLVFSLLLCLPFLGPALGLILGVTALARISTSGGRLRGRGLAAGGMVVGAVLLLVEGCLGLGGWLALDMATEQAATTIRIVEAEDVDSAKRTFAAGQREEITEASLATFAAALRERCGDFESAHFDWGMGAMSRGATLGNRPGGQQVELPLRLEFSKGPAYAVLRMEPDQQSGALRTVRLTVYPEAGEVLELPPRE